MFEDEYRFGLEPVEVPRVETAHRRVATPIPPPGTREIMEAIAARESLNALRQLPVIWDRAEGYQIVDRHGNRFIDFTSTIFVTNCGHGHPHMRATIGEAAEKLLHSYLYPTEIKLAFLDKLIETVPSYLEKALLFSTGTEASERAIMLARHHGMRFRPERRVIVGWESNYHGFSMGALMAGGFADARKWIGYQDPGMVQMPFPYPWEVEKTNLSGAEMFRRDLAALADCGVDPGSICALILETFQGWGALFYPVDYVHEARAWSREHDVLMIFDEIQAGFGRTGRFFGYEHYDVEPDLVICGKGMSSSLPLSAVLGPTDIINLASIYTSTHGGHPLSCAAGIANLEILERENLVAEAARKEAIVLGELARWKERFPDRIGRIYGKGLLFAIFIVRPGTKEEFDNDFCDRIVERSMQKGVFHIRTARGTIKLGPPLSIPDDALIEGLRATEEAIAELVAEDNAAGS